MTSYEADYYHYHKHISQLCDPVAESIVQSQAALIRVQSLGPRRLKFSCILCSCSDIHLPHSFTSFRPLLRSHHLSDAFAGNKIQHFNFYLYPHYFLHFIFISQYLSPLNIQYTSLIYLVYHPSLLLKCKINEDREFFFLFCSLRKLQCLELCLAKRGRSIVFVQWMDE